MHSNGYYNRLIIWECRLVGNRYVLVTANHVFGGSLSFDLHDNFHVLTII
jgi:hypothetical protein